MDLSYVTLFWGTPCICNMIDDDCKRREKRIQVGEGWRLGGDGDDDVETF